MNRYEFGEIIVRLENYIGIKANGEAMAEYFRRFGRHGKEDLNRAIDILIDEHEMKTFPLVPEFRDALERAKREQPGASSGEDSQAAYCERCEGSGLVLSIDGMTVRPCGCPKGRLRAAVWRLPISMSAVRKEKEIEKLTRKMPRPEPPVRGLHERNPRGFWEDTQEEHDCWMAEKRRQIEEIDKRRAGQPAEPAPRYGEAEWQRTLMKTVADLVRPREPGEDEEEEVPF